MTADGDPPRWWAPSGPRLRAIAGVQEELLARVPLETARYTALGALLVGTALIAATSMWLALRQINDAGWGFSIVLVVPALAWGLFILVVDRALITGITTTSQWRRSSTLAVRLVVAAVLGLVVAEPLILQVFNSAIEERITTRRDTERDTLRDGLVLCNPVPGSASAGPQSSTGCEGLLLAVGTGAASGTAELNDLRGAVAALQAQVDADRANQLVLDETARRECAGEDGEGLSGRRGLGPLCEEARTVAEEFAASAPVSPRVAELATMRSRIAQLEGPAAASREAYETERNALVDARVAELEANRATIGLLERLDTLDELTAEQPGLLFREWFLRAFLVAVDMLPVLVKVLGGITAYDRMADRRTAHDRDLHTAETEADHRVRTARVHAEAEKAVEDIELDLNRHRADRTAETNAQIAERAAAYEHLFAARS